MSLQPDLWSPSEMLSLMQKSLLEQRFFINEIKSTIFSCNPSKTPGLDDIYFLFYQTYWELVQFDLNILFQSFYNRQFDVSKLNLDSICLIPKKSYASTIKNYRPISLINCNFKLITKLLTNRLSQVMDPLIDDSQAAFIKGRLI